MLSSLAPAISHAMAPGHGSSTVWQEVCSAEGNKIMLAVNLDTQQPVHDDGSDSMSLQHCPYCLTHANPVGLIPAAPLSLAVPDLSYSAPELFYHSPYPLFAWAAGNPRAPPTHA